MRLSASPTPVDEYLIYCIAAALTNDIFFSGRQAKLSQKFDMERSLTMYEPDAFEFTARHGTFSKVTVGSTRHRL